MKIPATELYKAVRKVRPAKFDPRIPVMNHVKIACLDGEVLVTPTNSLDGRAARVPAVLDGDTWATCAPAITHIKKEYPRKSANTYRPFEDYLKVCASYDDTLTLEFNPDIQTLTIRAGASITRFKCIDAREAD